MFVHLYIFYIKMLEKERKFTAKDMTNLTKLINAKDQRKEEDDNGIIPRFKYRYRPICREGMTILHYAMIYGDTKIVEYLLKKGAGNTYI